MWKTEVMMIYVLLIPLILFSKAHGRVDILLTPESANVSTGENVTLRCQVNNVDHHFYAIRWSHTPHNGPGPLQSNATLVQETLTLKSSLTLSNPGVNFTGLYFCEVHYTGRGGNLVSFATSLVSGNHSARISECHKSSGGGKVIHLSERGPSVDISCKAIKEPSVPELRWRFLQRTGTTHTGIEFSRDDDGIYRFINSTLEWDTNRHDLILYCKAIEIENTILTSPCVIGLIKVIQQPQIIPRNTSLGFGFVNEVEFWCDMRGVYHQSCSYTWKCQPQVPGCHSDNDTILFTTDESTSLGDEIDVTCQVKCVQDFLGEAHATLTILYESSTLNSMVSAEGAGIALSLQSHPVPESDDNFLRCSANYIKNNKPIFAWYVDGIKQGISASNETMPNHQEVHSTYRVGHTFLSVVCDVLYDGNIIRVWSTFSEVIGTTSDTISFTTNDSVLTLSPIPALTRSLSLPIISIKLVIINSICASLAVLVFVWITFSLLRGSRYWGPVDNSTAKTFKVKSKLPSDNTEMNLTMNKKETKPVSSDSLEEYAYPGFQMQTTMNDQNEVEHFAFTVASRFYRDMEHGEDGYEEFPDEKSWQHGSDSHQGSKLIQPYQNFAFPSSSSSNPPLTPPLVHEYYTTSTHSEDHDRGFCGQDSSTYSLHHEYHA
ncbi:uncharacterized protein LOC121411528 [Lytechinus variegatus]|uniref:uncharacterized protein LOC121411528 n=1 Tax=Lytechinus variegatus TaxID=7654 RepID=UPI001BB14E14|nr:uncharacterized protein LOC121411528 [Lytechinus variegatus]